MNYLFLPGVSSNYASAPDAAGVDITGDIDVRNFFAPYSFRPAAEMDLLTKWEATGNKKCWATALATSGVLRFYFTTDGSTTLTRSSTAAITANPGTPIWTRATLKADNGASGHDVTFYTSSDGVTWVQLGAVVTTAGTVTMANASSSVRIGTESVNTASLYSGKYFYGEIRSGIGGSVVANPDFRGYVSSGSTDSVGNVWTVNTSGVTLAQLVSRSPVNRLFLPGVVSNYASAPDTAAFQITADMDVRVYLAPATWSPSATKTFIGQRGAIPQRSWYFSTNSTPRLFVGLDFTGDGSTEVFPAATAAVPFNPGQAGWVRFTRISSTGVVTFFTSTDGVTWVQLGNTVTSTTGAIFNSTAPLEVGSNSTGAAANLSGNVYYAEVRNSVGGTIVASPDFRGQGLVSGFSDSSGNVWTVNTSGTPAAALVSRTVV